MSLRHLPAPALVTTFLGIVAMLTIAACGGQTTGPGTGGSSSGGSGSSGSSGSSSGSGGSGSGGSSGGASSGGFGCGSFSTTTSNVDPTICAPQLQSATSCDGQVCSYSVEIPCLGDGGTGFAGVDAGTEQCSAWCNAAAPKGAQPGFGFCQLQSIDGGTAIVARCGGCGI